MDFPLKFVSDGGNWGLNPSFWGRKLAVPLNKKITHNSIMVRDRRKSYNFVFDLSENILLLVSMVTVVTVAGHVTQKCAQ